VKARGRPKERKEEEAAAKAKREADAMGEFERGRNTDSLEARVRLTRRRMRSRCMLYAACCMRVPYAHDVMLHVAMLHAGIACCTMNILRCDATVPR
jgi:hypothetical protein